VGTRTLLVPLDGSPVATVALPYARAIAQALDASIQLLAVIEPQPRGLARSEHRAAQIEQMEQEFLDAALNAAAAQLRAEGLVATTHLVRGDPAAAILDAAKDESVAMVIMGTHGRGGVDRWGVGSVADQVMRRNTKPTLLVRLPYTPASGQTPIRSVALRRLLVPLDGSPLAEAALPLATELATATGAQLVLLRVEPWLTVGSAPYGAVAEFTKMEDEAAAAAANYLAAVRQRLPAGLSVDTVVLRGRPTTSLVDFALYEQVDLVIMTTHGRGGLRRLVLGSVADHVVRAGVPALLIPPQAVVEAKDSAGTQ
jgi:nucleotide-binding universal stress UspA family protein